MGNLETKIDKCGQRLRYLHHEVKKLEAEIERLNEQYVKMTGMQNAELRRMPGNMPVQPQMQNAEMGRVPGNMPVQPQMQNAEMGRMPGNVPAQPQRQVGLTPAELVAQENEARKVEEKKREIQENVTKMFGQNAAPQGTPQNAAPQGTPQSAAPQRTPQNAVPQGTPQSAAPQRTPQNAVPQRNLQNIQPQNLQQKSPEEVAKKKAERLDFEKTIGKVLMGICASLMIFVSLIVFAIWAVPKMGDTSKMVLMFTVSFLFAIVGNLLLIKDKSNKLYLSLAGCGMGAIYVSLLITKLYFGAISDTLLYIFILIWAVVICVLSRLRSVLFLAIGQSGVLISGILGMVHTLLGGDGSMFLFLIIYYIVAESVFLLVHMKRKAGANILNWSFALVSLCYLTIGACVDFANSPGLGVAAAIVLMIFELLLIVLSLTVYRYETVVDNIFFGIGNAFLTSLICIVYMTQFHEASVVLLIFLAILMLVMELISRRKFGEAKFTGRMIYTPALLFLFAIIWIWQDTLLEYTVYAIPAIVCLYYGHLGKKKIYVIAGYVFAVLTLIIGFHSYSYIFTGIAIFALYTLLYLFSPQKSGRYWRSVIYPAFAVFAVIATIVAGVSDLDTVCNYIAVFLLLGFELLFVILSLTVFNDGNRLDRVLIEIGSSVLAVLIFSLYMIHFADYDYILLIVLGVFLAITEGLRLYEIKKDSEKCRKVALRITLLLLFTVVWMMQGKFFDYVTFSIPAIICLCYGYIGNRKLYKGAGYLYGIITVFVVESLYPYIISTLAVFAVFTILTLICRKHYSTIVKMVAYLLFLLFVIIAGQEVGNEYEWSNLNISLKLITSVSVINVLFGKIPFLYRDLKDGNEEKAFRVETGVIHFICMMVSLLGMIVFETVLQQTVITAVTFLLFAINTPVILRAAGTKWGSFITATKLLIYIAVLLWVHNAPAAFFSLVTFALAIIFIVCGFLVELKFDRGMKPLRIFGLVLALMCTVKLLLVDIYYENKLLLALNLFTSGILCFAISFVYNVIDKVIRRNKEKQGPEEIPVTEGMQGPEEKPVIKEKQGME